MRQLTEAAVLRRTGHHSVHSRDANNGLADGQCGKALGSRAGVAQARNPVRSGWLASATGAERGPVRVSGLLPVS
jgi:hypothetical protein